MFSYYCVKLMLITLMPITWQFLQDVWLQCNWKLIHGYSSILYIYMEIVKKTTVIFILNCRLCTIMPSLLSHTTISSSSAASTSSSLSGTNRKEKSFEGNTNRKRGKNCQGWKQLSLSYHKPFSFLHTSCVCNANQC